MKPKNYIENFLKEKKQKTNDAKHPWKKSFIPKQNQLNSEMKKEFKKLNMG